MGLETFRCSTSPPLLPVVAVRRLIPLRCAPPPNPNDIRDDFPRRLGVPKLKEDVATNTEEEDDAAAWLLWFVSSSAKEDEVEESDVALCVGGRREERLGVPKLLLLLLVMGNVVAEKLTVASS